MGEMEAGFAKLQGEDFEYYMQTYTIVLGRNSKNASVDVDLAGLGGGKNISREHARIRYDFERRRFVLEVMGKNGCYVEGVLYLPVHPPVKLDSQDLLQIGEKRFYFLLPVKEIARTVVESVAGPSNPNPRKRLAVGSKAATVVAPAKKARGQAKGGLADNVRERKQLAAPWMQDIDPLMTAAGSTTTGRNGYGYDEEADILHDERELVELIASKLQSQYHPGEWMAVSKLHGDIQDQFQGRNLPILRQIMGVNEGGQIDRDGTGRAKPWSGLVNMLKRYPKYFVINTKLKGGIRVEYVSLAMVDQ